MFLRTFHTEDFQALLDLTVRAFTPIQHGIRHQLGDELFARQNGQWEQDYRDTLTELTRPENRHRFLVVDLDGPPAGYAAWATHPGPMGLQGEITLLAVDPRHQQAGIGRLLIDATCEAMRSTGCGVAWVSTGGDEAHGPARAAYAAAGFVPLPTVFYSRLL
jgi:GNAT superfamily N-acetyltransferase